MIIDTGKNRQREAPSFANINLLGRCNCDCFFCLGKDLISEIRNKEFNTLHYQDWKNFSKFLKLCREAKIEKLYITGLNTDSLLYRHLQDLIMYIQSEGFKVGLRTNGYLAPDNIDIINLCDLEIGYTVLSLNPIVNKMICGRQNTPNWEGLLKCTKNPRIQIVINRCNKDEFFSMIQFFAQYKNKIPYIQARKVSTDKRIELLQPDMDAFEQVYSITKRAFPFKGRLWEDAEVYNTHGIDVCFWRIVKTTINSYNYFPDGTISKDYFIVEGYLKNRVVESLR